MKDVLLRLLLGVFLVGCTDQLIAPLVPIPICVSTSVEGSVVSRGVALNKLPLDRIHFLRKDSMLTPSDFSDLVLFQGDRMKDGSIVFDTPKPCYFYVPFYAYLVAYHPGGHSAANSNTWVIDGKTDILVAPVFNTGTYSVVATDPMVFKHQLAQLEVVCKADISESVSEGVVQYVWGKITGVELVGTPTTLQYNYANITVSAGATKGDLSLVQSDYDTDFSKVTITKNTEDLVTAAGMFVPDAAGSTQKITLKIYTELRPEGKQIEVQLTKNGVDAGFEVGQCHRVVLQFKVKEKQIELLQTAVEDWSSGYAGGGVLER